MKVRSRFHNAHVHIAIIVFSIAFILASSLISTTMATTISGVPDYAQATWVYCGPASLEDVFDFYGPDIDQYEIADAARTDPRPDAFGTYTGELRRAAHFSDLSTSQGLEIDPGSVTGYTARGLGYAAFEAGFRNSGWAPGDLTPINTLKPLIDAGYPIIVLQQEAIPNKKWGHFRVVTGYDDATQTIYVNDPNPNPETYTYDAFLNLWDWSSNMWGLVVCPWEVSLSAPATAAVGDTFIVTATVTYPCPSPFSTVNYPASSSQATIQLPAGLTLTTGETNPKNLGGGTMLAGGSDTVQWSVDAVSAGSLDISVEAEGRVAGNVFGFSVYNASESPREVIYTYNGYSYTDRIGGTSSVSVTVGGPVPQDPIASFVFSPDPGTENQPISFDASGSSDPDGTIVSYAWDFGDGATGTGVNPDHTYAADGTYTVTLTVTDNDGHTDTEQKTVTVARECYDLTVLVKDATTKNPIAGATVQVTGPEAKSGSTDATGFAVFLDLLTGDYTATASATGYLSNSATVTLDQDQQIQIELSVLAPPTITVTCPNGGEKWIRGTVHTITWSKSGSTGSYVKIELLKGGVVNRVITSCTANDGSYSWTIPSTQTPGTDYKIRITSTSYSSISDSSNSNFAIVAGTLTVTSPNGGQKWVRGTTHAITWSSSGSPGSYVKIELLKGGVVNRVITSSTANDGSYSWTISSTQTLGTDYRIRITSTSKPSITDSSNSNFAIARGTLTVTSPNGGESWKRGTTHTITWSKSGSTGSYVKIELLKGGVVNRVITSCTANDGCYTWTIPSTQTAGTDYKIRITSTAYSSIRDSSNSNFKITT